MTASGQSSRNLPLGGLKCDSNYRLTPVSDSSLGNLNYATTPEHKITIFYIPQEDDNPIHYGLLLMYALDPFYKDTTDNTRKALLIKSYFTLMTIMIQGEGLAQIDQIKMALKERNIVLNWEELVLEGVEPDLDSVKATIQAEFQIDLTDLIDQLGPAVVIEILGSRQAQAAVSSIFLMLYVKNLIQDNISPWFKRRLRGFLGSLGCSFENSAFPNMTAPSLPPCQVMNAIISGHFSLRKALFIVYVHMAHKQGYFQPAFKAIITLSRGHEMNHIMLIDEMLFGRFLELARHKYLAGSWGAMRNALDYLGSLHPTERYFAKLLYPPDETTMLNRSNFQPFHDCAVAVASLLSPTYKNIKGVEETMFSEKMKDIATTYFALRGFTAQVAFLDTPEAQVGPREERFLTDIITSQIRQAGTYSVGTQERGYTPLIATTTPLPTVGLSTEAIQIPHSFLKN